MTFFAKIAVELKDAVARRRALGEVSTPPVSRTLAQGEGWSVEDLVCTCGPQDRPFEERHDRYSVALVLAGTFQYRAVLRGQRTGHVMMPGSLLLGNPGQGFECSHDHGQGDRCLSFHFAPEYFERIAADAGAKRDQRMFQLLRLPARREMSPLVARACGSLAASCVADAVSDATNDRDASKAWEEIAIQAAASALQLANTGTCAAPRDPLPSAAARVTRAVRLIEENLDTDWSLARLSSEAGLSLYHFLRVFEQVTGLTPHQYIRRLRLRSVAAQLLAEPANIVDVVFDCGFGDLANFNRAFRNEFGVSPRQFRRREGVPPETLASHTLSLGRATA